MHHRTYRAYRLDERKRIITASWVEAANDSDAKDKAADELCDGDTPSIEIWEATRLVDEIDCEGDD